MSVMSSTIFKSSTIYNSGDQRKLCKTAKVIWYVVDFWPFQRDKNKSCCFHMKSHKTDTSLTFASLKLYSDAWCLFPHGTVFASSFVPKMPKPSSLIWKLQKWSLRNVEFLFCTFWRSHPRLPKIYLKITNDLWICKNLQGRHFLGQTKTRLYCARETTPLGSLAWSQAPASSVEATWKSSSGKGAWWDWGQGRGSKGWD